MTLGEMALGEMTISRWYGVPFFRCRPRVCVFSPQHDEMRMQVISPNAISPKNLVESFRLKQLGEMTKRE